MPPTTYPTPSPPHRLSHKAPTHNLPPTALSILPAALPPFPSNRSLSPRPHPFISPQEIELAKLEAAQAEKQRAEQEAANARAIEEARKAAEERVAREMAEAAAAAERAAAEAEARNREKQEIDEVRQLGSIEPRNALGAAWPFHVPPPTHRVPRYLHCPPGAQKRRGCRARGARSARQAVDDSARGHPPLARFVDERAAAAASAADEESVRPPHGR